MGLQQDINYLISKIGNVDPGTKAKAVEIIKAANAAGHSIRFVWGLGGPPEHSTGLAVDIMVNDKAAGDFVRAYVWANRARLQLRHVIWYQTITSTVVQPGVVRKMADRGSPTENHMDHNHIMFLAGGYTAPPKPAAPVSRPAPAPAPARPTPKTATQIAHEVWMGLWGSGDDRTNRLKKAGYNPAQIQDLVNRGVGRTSAPLNQNRPSVTDVARQVVAGKWGNGPDRVARLTRAGYNAADVQREVNRLV